MAANCLLEKAGLHMLTSLPVCELEANLKDVAASSWRLTKFRATPGVTIALGNTAFRVKPMPAELKPKAEVGSSPA